MKFIDEVNITVASGRGGPGAVSWRREIFAPRGGPDGGDGGRGGDVIFKVAPNLNSLMDFRHNKKYSAVSGGAGAAANMTGANGDHLILLVPKGTIVRNTSGEVIIDMTDISEYTFLKGGRGGKGNTFFKNSINQAPDYAQPGEEGQQQDIILELKLIADVGIIGFPNAGKSTLISRISAARPKIADYPFTTLTPNLGVVKVGDYHSFMVADIPGLIHGASDGHGLGVQFLKHIERTSLFIHMIDVSGASGRDPIDDYNDLNTELSKYDSMNTEKDGFQPLSVRKQIVVLNKIDSVRAEALDSLKRKFKKETGVEPYSVSAVSGLGLKELIHDVSKLILKEDIEQ